MSLRAGNCHQYLNISLKSGVVLSLYLSTILLTGAMMETAAFSQSKAQAEAKIVAKAKFSETVFNFGTVPEGTVVSHSFNFKNVGNSDLRIERVVAGCGCTAASSSMESIPPGQSATIKVDFNTDGFSGPKEKKVHVYSNSYENSEVSLSISGVVEREVMISPARILFENLVRGVEVAPKEFSVKINPQSGKKISSVTSYSKFIKVEKVDSGDSGDSSTGQRYRVVVDPATPIGELRDRILINLVKGSATSSLSLPVIGKVTGSLALEPAQVSFGIVEGKNKLKRTVKVENRGITPIDVVSVSSDTSSVLPSLKVLEKGKKFIVEIELDASQIKTDLRALIEIKTSSVEEPLLYLSVFGVVPPKLDY